MPIISHRRIVGLFALFGFISVESFAPKHQRLHGPPSQVSQQKSTLPLQNQFLRVSPLKDKTTTSLSLSLEDSWEEIARSVAATTKTVNLNEIYKSFSLLRWEAVFSKQWFATIAATSTDLFDYYKELPLWIEISVFAVPTVTAIAAALYAISFPPEDYRNDKEPYARGEYDPVQARVYYGNHKLLVLQRLLQLLRLSNRFLLNLALDKYIFRDEERQRPKRAKELLQLITKLGPTAIKVGQALSVRPDLIDEEYASRLATLQDRVPPFDGSAAREILRRELGAEKFGRFENLGLDKNEGPVASASIGQVYRGFVDGREVAVKIQRPGGLAEIGLDLYIVREFAPYYQKITGGATDLQSLANEWGRGFIDELDYRKEAESTTSFSQLMKRLNLNAVGAPKVQEKYSTEQVLVTEWIDGTRLDESDAEDVPRLCSVALNAYLVMLLEPSSSSIHCDPHPGNLLRTPDGRLVILDFGMTLEVDPDLQYSLLEFVAHLTAEDYDLLPNDLVKLGFLKPDKLEFARRSGVLEPLKFFLKQANGGGGAKGVRERIFAEYRVKYPGLTDDELRVEMRSEMKQQMAEIVERESIATGVTVEIEELQKRNRDSFMIPEWFLYTSRAFLTLEGVSLQADENYSLIKSCFPYVAKRLVADDDPRSRKALKDLIYGASESVDVERLSDLADGFSSYTTTTKTVNQQAKAQDGEIVLIDGSTERVSKQIGRRNKMVEAEAAITLAKDSADILLAKDGNLVQNLLVEESALAASAGFKDRMRDALVDGPKRFRESLPFGAGSYLPPLPFESQVEPFVRKTEKELKAQRLAEKLTKIAPQQGSSEDDDFIPHEATARVVESLRELEPEQAALVLKELRENVPKYAPLLGELGGKFVSTLLKTASTNIETTLVELEAAGEHPDSVTSFAAKRFSSAAQRGADAFETTTDKSNKR